MLKIEHISKTFNPGTVNEKQAIRDLSLNLEKGDFATIIGSNGAGKSTLFNAICGDFLTDSGVIMLDLTRTGGKRYKPGETERLIHDSFIVQVPMLFEDYNCLAVDKGTHGSYLPVQMEPETVLYFYPQWTE